MDAKQVIAKQFAMQTHLFNNVLEGINDKEGLHRPGGRANHLRWIAGHLINTRYNIAGLLNATTEQYPHTEKFADKDVPPPNTRALNIGIDYPSMEDSLMHWQKISPVFTKAVANMSAEQAAIEMPFGTPIGDKSLQSFLAFLTHHEAYHIGQMSLLRRDLGHPAMSYKM